MPESDEPGRGMLAGETEAPGLAEPPEEAIGQQRPSSVIKVGIVGPCGAGKSTLAQVLRERGIAVHEIAQEHSGVPAMWERIARPDRLIYLHVSREVAEQRLERALPPDWWEEITARLAHARAHASLIVETDNLTPDQVAEQVLEFLAATGATAFTTK